MKGFLGTITVVACSGYLLFCVLLYFNQRNMMYMAVPENPGVRAGKLEISSDGVKIRVWKAGSGDTALLYFGGNAEDVAWNIADFEAWFPGHTIYLVNYRGYGGSGGKPTQAGLYQDALAVFDRVARDHDRVKVMGRSLGCAVAGHLAVNRKVHSLAMVTPFDSALNIARGLYPYMPVRLLMRDPHDLAAIANRIEIPVLVLMAADDEVVSAKRSQALVESLPEATTRVVTIGQAGHNDVHVRPAYGHSLRQFFAG